MPKQKNTTSSRQTIQYSLLGPTFSNQLKKRKLELRLSQVKIVNFLLNIKSAGLIFATSLGKTIINILFIDAVWTLPNSDSQTREKFLITVPTVDLAHQFKRDLNTYRKFADDEIVILANKSPQHRKQAYQSSAVVFIATPHVIYNDLKNQVISKDFFQILIIDEAHHTTGDYPSKKVADIIKPYVKIIAQTATAGDKKKREIIKNTLNIEDWYRVEVEEELAWLNPINRIEVNIPLNETDNSEWFKIYKKFLKYYYIYKNELYEKFIRYDSKQKYITKSKAILTFREMEKLKLAILKIKDRNVWPRIMHCWSAMRIINELNSRLFQEGYQSTFWYYDSLADKESGAAQRVYIDCYSIMGELESMRTTGIEHPKYVELVKILQENPSEQIIIFLNHTKPLFDLYEKLKVSGFTDIDYLVGRANRKQQSDKQAKKVITDFSNGKIRILLVSPVGFEGRHFPHINIGIAMNMFISPEQLMQAMGRLGRTKITDRMFFLMFGPQDRGQYYSGLRNIKKLYEDITLIPEEFTPIDPALETTNLDTKKTEFWAADLTKHHNNTIRERFMVKNVEVIDRGKLFNINFLLYDKTGYSNAVIKVPKNTPTVTFDRYKQLTGKVCIISGKAINEPAYNLNMSTININPYPDRQNIGPCPVNKINMEDYQ